VAGGARFRGAGLARPRTAAASPCQRPPAQTAQAAALRRLGYARMPAKPPPQAMMPAGLPTQAGQAGGSLRLPAQMPLPTSPQQRPARARHSAQTATGKMVGMGNMGNIDSMGRARSRTQRKLQATGAARASAARPLQRSFAIVATMPRSTAAFLRNAKKHPRRAGCGLSNARGRIWEGMS
jgi:hypothetical protein